MAEQLRLEKCLRDGRTVHGHERPRRPVAGVMDGARDQLLTPPRLAQDRYSRAGRRGAPRLLERAAEHRTRPDDPAEVVTDGPSQLDIILTDRLLLTLQGFVEPRVLAR